MKHMRDSEAVPDDLLCDAITALCVAVRMGAGLDEAQVALVRRLLHEAELRWATGAPPSRLVISVFVEFFADMWGATGFYDQLSPR